MKQKDKVFFGMWIMFAVSLFIRFYNHTVMAYDSTMYAFWYKYGFISRGFVGTLYHVVNKLMPIDMINYQGVLLYTIMVTGIFFIFVFWYFVKLVQNSEESYKETLEYVIIFFTFFLIPMFVNRYNFGRLDLYLVAVSLISSYLIMKEKHEWMLVPLSMVGIMVHQGYAFMYYNIILVFLVFKILSKEGKEKKKYIRILCASLITCIALFLWFELFSHGNSKQYFEEISGEASYISKDHDYHEDVIDKEILGIDLSDREVEYNLMARVSFVFFLLFFSPYIVLGVKFFKDLVKNVAEKKEKLKYLLVACGPLTLLPLYLFKCDYGRWTFALIAYYCIAILTLIGAKDTYVSDTLKSHMFSIKGKKPWAAFLLVYPIMFQPFWDVCVSEWMATLAGYLNDIVLHWW